MIGLLALCGAGWAAGSDESGSLRRITEQVRAVLEARPEATAGELATRLCALGPESIPVLFVVAMMDKDPAKRQMACEALQGGQGTLSPAVAAAVAAQITDKVETTRGAEQTISTAKYEVTGRGGKGRELLQRGQFTRVIWAAPEAPAPLTTS